MTIVNLRSGSTEVFQIQIGNITGGQTVGVGMKGSLVSWGPTVIADMNWHMVAFTWSQLPSNNAHVYIGNFGSTSTSDVVLTDLGVKTLAPTFSLPTSNGTLVIGGRKAG